jgi:hypothetical protein
MKRKFVKTKLDTTQINQYGFANPQESGKYKNRAG